MPHTADKRIQLHIERYGLGVTVASMHLGYIKAGIDLIALPLPGRGLSILCVCVRTLGSMVCWVCISRYRYSAAVICITITHSSTPCTCHCSSYMHFQQSSHAILPVHASCALVLARLLAVMILHGYSQDAVRLSCCLPSSCYYLSFITLLCPCHTASPLS